METGIWIFFTIYALSLHFVALICEQYHWSAPEPTIGTLRCAVLSKILSVRGGIISFVYVAIFGLASIFIDPTQAWSMLIVMAGLTFLAMARCCWIKPLP